MSEYIIETKDLSKTYGDFQAVKKIDMNVEKGKIYGLLGRNGAGKTTTMCMLLGLTEPTTGSIKLFGLDVKDRKNRNEIYKKIGSIIETPGFYPQLNARDNLKIFCKMRGDYKKENIEKVLNLVNLHEVDKEFKHYSLGMKQRLGLAAALVHEPELLILDEPINGLDPAGIIEIRDMLINVTKELGITVLISSHILSEIEILADEIGVINDGKLIKEITKDELSSQSKKKVIINVDDVPKAIKVLDAMGFNGETDYVVEGDNILIFKYLDSRSKVNSSFVKNGIVVNELHLQEENLEDYFMRLIGEV